MKTRYLVVMGGKVVREFSTLNLASDFIIHFRLPEAFVVFIQMKEQEQINELISVLRWIIERIEEEADKTLDGKKPNYKQAAIESVEEAYGVLSRVKANMTEKIINK